MKIEHYSFGSFIVDGKEYRSDIKLVESEVRIWHNHGLNLEDVRDVVDAKPSTIIIGTGSVGVVDVNEEIIDFIKGKGIKLIIAKTAQACKLYNELSKKENVAAILHSTC